MKKLNYFAFGMFILLGCGCAFGQKREVAITFDDLPTAYDGTLRSKQELTKKLLQSIKSNDVPAIGFVNENKLYVPGEIDGRTELLKMWLDAGLELGNHTFSHISLEQYPIESYEEDIIRGETVTRMLLNQKKMKLRYFRHPFLWTGNTVEYKNALDAFLKKRGYTIAPVTIDNNDYIFAYIYLKAKEKGDTETMRRVADAYVPYMEKMFDYFERLSKDLLGYEVKQVLLLHANELNADYFDKLAEMMRRRGYSFISLEEALKDKAYSLPEAQTKDGISWLDRWMLAKGLPLKPEPEEPEFISKLLKQFQQEQQNQNR